MSRRGGAAINVPCSESRAMTKAPGYADGCRDGMEMEVLSEM